MKKLFLIILLLYLLPSGFYSQQSSSMRMLANTDLHSADGQYSACWGYTAPNGKEYAILGCATGTAFIDISDTSNIRETAYLPGLNIVTCCREMKTYSHYAYVVADGITSGLQIIDLQYLPDSVSLVNTFFFDGFNMGHTISQEGPYLYINAGDYGIGGLFVLDLSIDPVNPVKRGEWEEAVVHDCRVINDTIYACNIYNPPGTVSIIDATNKNNLRTISSWINIPNPGPHNVAISPDKKYAYVSDEIGGSPRLLKIWDISNVFNVIKISDWQPEGITTSIIHNVELYKNYLFAAHYTAGLRVIDVSNPYNPVEAAWYDTYPLNNGTTYDGCWGVYIFESEKIIASDRATGLYVFKTDFRLNTSNPNTPNDFKLSQNYPNPFNPSTTINYSLKFDGYVSLKVYDSGGREVAALVDDFNSKGNKSVSFDASGIASGIYFYTLNVEYRDGVKKNFSESKKMAFIK